MNKVLFGAGNIGILSLFQIGKENVSYFIDNSEQKQGTSLDGIPVFSVEEKKEDLKRAYIIITMSPDKCENAAAQLMDLGITNFRSINVLKKDLVANRLKDSEVNIEVYNRAIGWVLDHSIKNEGIAFSTSRVKSYPEVTGYYIPTLIRWGYRDLAKSYAKWLCRIQKDDGSWHEEMDKDPYIFDTGQIIRGLLSARALLPEVDEHITRGCDWILSNMEKSGRLPSPRENEFGDELYISEPIHLYCLKPIIEAGKVFDRQDYIDKAKIILDYYKNERIEKLYNFDQLSHFYAYIMEALLDLGEEEIVRKAMEKVAVLQSENGAVPAYNNVKWTCSVGTFQFAIVWFRLGEYERGKRAFDYMCKLQNDSGGWYGSYISEESVKEDNNYFPNEEISWCNKFFLDALWEKTKAEFNNIHSVKNNGMFHEEIKHSEKSELLLLLYRAIDDVKSHSDTGHLRILDVGCGRGRYINELDKRLKNCEFYGLDISSAALEYLPKKENIHTIHGVSTNIESQDGFYDVVYCVETLEHAIDIESACREMARVTKKDGKVIIIDKPKEHEGNVMIMEWEQFLSKEGLCSIMSKYCRSVDVKDNLADENGTRYYAAWTGEK